MKPGPWRSQTSREFQLLLCCARQLSDFVLANSLRELIDQGVDWSSLRGLAHRHRVVPSVYLALSRAAGELVPPQEFAALRGDFEKNTRNSLRLAGELTAIARHFEAASIPVLALKGPAAAIQLYGGFQCRQFRDLDILVPPEQAPGAARILSELGYNDAYQPLEALPSTRLRRVLENHSDTSLVHAKREVLVELHWRLAREPSLFAIPEQRLWSARGPAALCGSRCHVLPLPEQIVYLAWHGGKHRWKRLSWLFDFYQALRHPDRPDWVTLARVAVEMKARRLFWLGLKMVAELLGHDFGEGFPDRLYARETAGLDAAFAAVCHALLADGQHYERRPLTTLQWTWQVSESWQPKLFAASALFAPNHEDLHRAPVLAYVKRGLWVARRSWEAIASLATRRAA